MGNLGNVKRPLRVAIVGSGPSGFYAVDALFKSDVAVTVDVFDRLPTPFGLVRLGVAPDHPKIKSVTRVYEKIAAQEGFGFLGNVMVGRDLSIEELRHFYDAIILASGAETDRRLGIPGEDLAGSHTATAFVAWYNGHPDYRDTVFDLSHETAVVIGQGNVAVDVCRILAKAVDELKGTDIAAHALDALAESRVKDIHMIGRRGPVQAKFTQQEIKEMGRLANCDTVVDPAAMDFDPLSLAEYEHPDNSTAPRIVPTLKEFSENRGGGKARRLHIQFLKSPVELVGSERVEKVVLERNELVGEPFGLKARGTGVREELPCGLVFRSVGYRGLPVPGVPFDEGWGTIPHEDGRVVDGDAAVPGLYVVGWIKRGPSGVIGTNKPDSGATVESLLADRAGLAPCPNPNGAGVRGLLEERGVRVVSFDDWRRIDVAELARGEAVGKPREKFVRVSEILSFLEGS